MMSLALSALPKWLHWKDLSLSSDRLSAEIWSFFLQLEMEDEDTIDVFQQQTGGSSL